LGGNDAVIWIGRSIRTDDVTVEPIAKPARSEPVFYFFNGGI
jgi:hypothetical protein